jgi:hypothetical protein
MVEVSKNYPNFNFTPPNSIVEEAAQSTALSKFS